MGLTLCAGVSGTVGETTLSVEQMPSHTHTYRDTHSASGIKAPSGSDWGYVDELRTTDSTGGSQSHTHDLSGSSGAASSLPPHYALAFVMQVS